MKGIIISIRKPHTDNIKALIKTIDVRKTKPRIERPFPAFIYEPKANGGCGKVIGEFVCRGMMDGGSPLLLKQSCLTLEEIFEYSQGKPIYGWRIADLKIYDEPKELSEFGYPCPKGFNDMSNYACYREVGEKLKFCRYNDVEKKECKARVKTPPQSWCYVEVEK